MTGYAVFLAGLGLIVGSFLNVCIYRLPRVQSVNWPGSRCTTCGRALSWFENIPVVSWLVLRGRCRTCGERVSAIYPIVEVITAALFVAGYFIYGWTPLLAVRLGFASAMVVLFAIDLEHHLLPNVITVPGVVIGFVLSFFLPPGWQSSLIGLIAGGGALFGIAEAWYRFRGVEGLGMGDVKMLAMIGAFLGWKLMLVTLMLSSFAGSLIGLGVIAMGRGGMKSVLPFGTFLAVGALTAAVAGDVIVDWLSRLLSMTQQGYAFLGMTAIVAGLAAVLVFALLRFAAGAREARRSMSERGGESPLLAAALQEAVAKLKAQEKAMTARAAASEQLSGDIVESLTAGLLVVDRSGRVEIFNGAGRAMVDVKGDPIGSDYQTVLLAFPPLVQLIEEGLATARPILRRSVQVEGGGPIHLGVTVSPLGKLLPHPDEGDATASATETVETGADPAPGVICLFSDLTAVVELEEQLRLKETLARLGELTAGLAHEFRNGLATIHGYSRLIEVDAMPPKYQPYVEGIRQEAEALGKVVTNFLSFARPENIVLSRVDLGVIARRATDDLRNELPAGTALNVDGTFTEVLGDEVLLRQVFGNLVRNAADACEGAGVTPDIRIHGWVDVPHHSCRVSVEDNGPGIPQAARERIFQPFFTTRSQGTGLGLAIVQKIVVLHNGRVTVADARGGGASIQISIPTAEG